MQLSFFEYFGERLLFRKEPPKPAVRPRAKRASPGRENDVFLYGFWRDLRLKWFPERDDLDQYLVYWSQRKQKRTLATCNIGKKRIIVARELNYSHLRPWLQPLLYHEMCHAYLGDSVYSKSSRSAWHGKEFRALERRHPQMREFNHWVKSGGWETAVRSDRAKRAWKSIRAVSI